MPTTSVASKDSLEPISLEGDICKSPTKLAAGQVQQVKKTIFDRTCHAKRVTFLRNGNRFYPGLSIPVSSRRYRTIEILTDELTPLLGKTVKLSGAVRTIYTMDGTKISSLDELADGQSYICACNRETFKKILYNISSQPLSNLTPSNTKDKVVQKSHLTSLPVKKEKGVGTVVAKKAGNDDNSEQKLSESNSLVRPRNITLIRNGTKPRRIVRLLLNNRNSSTFDEVISAIRNVMSLSTGEVRKIFALSGRRVRQLSDFFGEGDVFFAYGEESVNYLTDFKLRIEEKKVINKVCKNSPTFNIASHMSKMTTRARGKGLKNLKKRKNCQKYLKEHEGTEGKRDGNFKAVKLPPKIREHYSHGEIIGKGSFAVVVKINAVLTGEPYALKTIDKRKVAKHFIDAELLLMKKLKHPHIVSMVMNIDHRRKRHLILEYVAGGDLLDAMRRELRFSEDQSRLIIANLASAMEYLHAMNIAHRDIKPRHLLLELDSTNNVRELKLADFTSACEVTKPLRVCCGTPTHFAPEIIAKTGYGVKVDIWAAGVVLFTMLCGTEPFSGKNSSILKPLFNAICLGKYEFPEEVVISAGARDLIKHMLEYNPEKRFTSSEILAHYWILNGSDNRIRGRK